MRRIGSVVELWRYPVKSMRGEQCASLRVDLYGIEGDRRLAFESSRAPVGKPLLPSGERAAMLGFTPRQDTSGRMLVRTPAGQEFAADDLLLREALLGSAGEARTLVLREREKPFTDVRPIAFHSRATERALANELGGFDARRLRSNLVLELGAKETSPEDFGLPSGLSFERLVKRPFEEDRLSGGILQFGDVATVRVLERIPRCRMVALDPESAALDRSILQHLAQQHEGRAGVYAAPLHPGMIHVGDAVWLVEQTRANGSSKDS